MQKNLIDDKKKGPPVLLLGVLFCKKEVINL